MTTELEACKFCGESSQMLLVPWVGDTYVCTPCLIKSPRLLMIATMLCVKKRLVKEETSGSHRLDLVRNLQGLFGMIQSVIPNINPDLLEGDDRKAQIIEQKFIKAGHHPSDPTCNHAVWFAIKGPRPRHCSACMSSMVDYGD